MLKNLTESVRQTFNFDDLISEMLKSDCKVELSKNEKIGISGMRIILKSDINHQRQYKPGYKLSEISNTLKITEIKNIFEIKNVFFKESKTISSWKKLQENLYRKGWFVKIQYKSELKSNQKNEIQDIWIKKIGDSNIGQHKSGFFFIKDKGLSLSAIDSSFNDLEKGISSTSEVKNNENILSFIPKLTISETLKEVSEELIDDFLKPNYVAQEVEWWKKIRKMRR